MKTLYTLIILFIPFVGLCKTNKSLDILPMIGLEDSWKITSNLPFLNSEFRFDCNANDGYGDYGEERKVVFRDKYIFLGVGGETGGTILMTMYNSSKNLYKIIFANDNDGYGNGSIHEFFFKYHLNKIVFPDDWWDTDFNENSISNLTYHKCY